MISFTAGNLICNFFFCSEYTRVPHYSQYPNPMLSITSKVIEYMHMNVQRLCILKDVLFMQVQACGSMVTEEQPHAMLIPMEFFLMGYGLYRPSYFSDSPRSPLSPSCISPELLSPESMGLKLKPIKTRVSLEV